MSNPSFSNIDRWLFELMEGNLSPEQVAQLESFLIQHPELDVDKDVWVQTKIEQQEYVYPNQDKLIRRRPIGLYSALGFLAIVLLSSLAVYTNTSLDFNGDSSLAMQEDSFNGDSMSIPAPISTKYPKEVYENSNKGKYTETEHELKTVSSANYQSNSYASKRKLNVHSSSISLKTNVLSLQPENLIHQRDKELAKNERSVSSNVSKLSIVKAKPIVFVESTKDESAQSTRSFVRFAKSDYKITLGSRIHKLGRNLQRMLDNPIALRNQRDPSYHVPGMQAMDVNFSSVGTMLATRVQTSARAQWLGSENQQIMSQLAIDGYSYAIRGGLGFQMSHNYYGTGQIENYTAALTYSPKFSVSRGVTVEPSIRFKMGSKLLDSKTVLPGTQVEYDRSTVQEFLVNGSAPIGRQLWYKDLGLGLMVNTKWFYAGIQGDDLFNHYDNIYSNSSDNQRRVGSHFVATLGTDYESIKKTMTVSPYLVYQQRENLKEAWLGTNLRLKWLTVGGAISSNLDPAASIGLKFQHFAITYNADYTQSALLNQRSLSHQMTIRFVSKPSRIGQRLLN